MPTQNMISSKLGWWCLAGTFVRTLAGLWFMVNGTDSFSHTANSLLLKIDKSQKIFSISSHLQKMNSIRSQLFCLHKISWWTGVCSFLERSFDTENNFWDSVIFKRFLQNSNLFIGSKLWEQKLNKIKIFLPYNDPIRKFQRWELNNPYHVLVAR